MGKKLGQELKGMGKYQREEKDRASGKATWWHIGNGTGNGLGRGGAWCSEEGVDTVQGQGAVKKE